MIIGGVTVGDNAVIAAGSVVIRDAGNPARVIANLLPMTAKNTSGRHRIRKTYLDIDHRKPELIQFFLCIWWENI